MPTRFEITIKTVLFSLAMVAGLWILVQIRDILYLLFIAFILMSALRPTVDALERRGIPRLLATMSVYTVVISIIAVFLTIVFPPLISQTVHLLENLPHYLTAVLPFIQVNFETLLPQIGPLGQNVARFTIGVFSNLFTLVTIGVFTFYFLLERKHLSSYLNSFVGDGWSKRILQIVHKVEDRMGAWVRGQLILGSIVGVASYLGLSLLGVSYALPLALIAGVLEMVPIIGPFISAVPAVLVALIGSPGLALATVALYIIIQQLENNLIVPTVMRHAVGIPPLASLLALLVGGRLGGVVGVLLAVPTLLVIGVLIQEFVPNQKS